jgi:hypothetical protein
MLQSGGTQLGYKAAWHATLGHAGTWIIQKVTAGPTFTTLTIPGGGANSATGTSFTVNVGDTLTLCAVPNGGTTYLSLYWNEVLVCTATDTSYSSGYPGIYTEPQSASPSLQANASISAFAAGTLQNATSITFSISGNAGVAGATVSYSGTSSGSVTADGSGNYTISGLAPGTYTITPSLAGYTFVPMNLSETSAGSNITGANFTAAAASHYSVPDARNYGNFPNDAINVNGTLIYTVPAEYSLQWWFDIFFSRTQPLPEDCRAAGAPAACGTYPQNSRAPGVNGPGN